MKAALLKCFLPVLFCVSVASQKCEAYSILAHEAIIDACWKGSILPLLKNKYPNATSAEIKMAHSYAYGGCLVADMGYYPFGNPYFTNLLHYVRSGDMVESLFAEARNVNEYAFAIGALAHYLTDEFGHSLSTNLAVPIVYPKMEHKFGHIVTYDEDNTSHKRMEFAFDVLQTARGNYASDAYHDFIGFNVAIAQLERAFLKTYGQDLNDVFPDISLTVSTFRWSVTSLLPAITRTAWALKKDEILKYNPAASGKSFHYKLKRREYNQQFGKRREKPSFGNRVFAFLIKISPKIGPLKALKFKDPGPAGEKLFINGFDTVLVHYSNALKDLQAEQINLANIDFDTGNKTKIGEYGLTDKTYADLLVALQTKKYAWLTSPLKQDILSFYNTPDSSKFEITDLKERQKANLALQQIKKIQPNTLDAILPAMGKTYKMIQDTTYHHNYVTR